MFFPSFRTLLGHSSLDLISNISFIKLKQNIKEKKETLNLFATIGCMLGRRSLESELIPLDTEIDRTYRASKSLTMEPNQDTGAPRQLREYFTPSKYTDSPCIQIPTIEAIQYEINSSVIQMLPSFYGLTNEDPYKRLDKFLEICSTVKI